MKKKILFAIMTVFILTIAYENATAEDGGCGVPQCGGGYTWCCMDKDGNLFYKPRNPNE